MIDTFSKLIDTAGSEKVYLMEIATRVQITDWTYYLTNSEAEVIYYHDFDYDVRVIGVTSDGTALEDSDVDLCDAWEGNNYDKVGRRLYVCVTGTLPHAKTVVAEITAYFATTAKVFSDNYYEPLLASIPSITQEKGDWFWGVSIVSGGSAILANAKGYFDSIFDEWAWENASVTVKLGGEDLPYSEYATVFDGIISEKRLSTAELELVFVDKKNKWDDAMELHSFDKVTYPALSDEDEGRMVPLVWGTVYRMPVVCVTQANGTATTTHTFKVADTSLHPIEAIDHVYVDGSIVPFSGTSLSAATFRVGSVYYEPGREVSADVVGYQSGSVSIENGIDVLREIGEKVLGITFASATWDVSALATARAEAESSPVGLAVYDTETKAIDAVGDIMKSIMGSFYITNEGKYAVSIWTTDIPEEPDELDENDLREFSAESVAEDIRKLVRVGWRKNWEKDEYSYAQATASAAEYVYGITRSRTVPTLLSSSEAAQRYADRMLLFYGSAPVKISFDTKLRLAQKNIGDRFALSFRRRTQDPYFSWIEKKIVEIQAIDKRYKEGVVAVTVDDLRGIGANIGHWTADPPEFPATYGGGDADPWDANWPAEKKEYASAHFGYWTDTYGFIDQADADSYKTSLWW